ncbi:MAG: type 4a pilus biogenesis protein PilO [Kofleriaceae bacterium]
MADFARLPQQRKVMIFVVAGFLMFLLYYQFVFKSLNKDLDEARAQHDAKVAASHKADADIKMFNDLKPAVNRLKAQIDQNEKALPTEAELPAFFETLNRKVTESGVQVNRSTQQPEAPIEAFVRVPVDFEIQGTFMQIKKFFASLVPKRKQAGSTEATPNGDQGVEERERIVSIDNLTIGDPVVRNRQMILTAKFTANTYRQDEKLEPAAAKPAAGAAAPAPARATTPAKPMPPAATPAGAKARANDAMNKDEKRSGSDAQRLKGGL